MIQNQVELLEALLTDWQDALGADYDAYRNHCYRVLNVTLQLAPQSSDNLQKVAVAVAFHDLAIWAKQTFDYIEPSADMARSWLLANGHAEWVDEVLAMIRLHHKMTPCSAQSTALIESFRQADWCDVSLGLLRFKLNKAFLVELKQQFPNAGFHRRLVQLSGRQFVRHPFNPLPMMRW